MNIDYSLIEKIFEHPKNTGYLSMNNLDDFFANLEAGSRSMVEYFMRTELGIDIYQYLTKIPSHLYYKSEGINELVIPETVISVNEKAFANSNIRSIEFKNKMPTFDIDMFIGCRSLKTIIVPDGTKCIEAEAVMNYSPSFTLCISRATWDDIIKNKKLIISDDFYEYMKAGHLKLF